MSFEKSFCPSPWFHMRINNSGHYEYCRWLSKDNRIQNSNIRTESPIEFFKNGMSEFRSSFLRGESPHLCRECDTQDKYHKVSGRQRQLLKIGVSMEHYNNSMMSSPWFDEFESSYKNNGQTEQLPQDWQIDLGNFCNSGCIFCDPYSSSWIATEYKKLGLIQQLPAASWAEDPALLAKFIDALKQSKSLAYLHFIGGETLITPAFKVILTELINQGLHVDTTIGFTTNLTVWRQDIVDLLVQFKSVNFGASVECFHPVNDYLRFPSSIQTVTNLLAQWLAIAKQHNWVPSLRITPTVFSVWHLDTIYQYAQEHQMIVESCNFLEEPAYMRPSLLPENYRQHVIEKLQRWVDQSAGSVDNKVVNVRNITFYQDQLVQDAVSYIKYFKEQDHEEHRLPELVNFIKVLERSRNNSILTYLPEYEELLRPAGY